MKSLLILILSLTFSSAINATPNDNEAPNYIVEVLIFKNLQNNEENEIWTQTISPEVFASLENARPLSGDITPGQELSTAFEKMASTGNYLLVTHKRWVQVARPKEDERLIRITKANEGLDGTVHFYRDRFLHLDLNLILGEDTVPVASLETSGGANKEKQQDNFIIKEKRKVRSDMINYFDHPKFGVLITVSPLKVSKS